MKLKSKFLPKFKTTLIRLGRDNDGGYCIAEKSLNNTEILYSFGLSDDWSFERDFINKNLKTKAIVFDKSVNLTFWAKGLIKNIIGVLLLKKNPITILKYFFVFFNYYYFFNKTRVKHFKKNLIQENHLIKHESKDLFVNLNYILATNKGKSFFLKIDIEGNEYRILDDIINHQDNLEGLVIEFHNSDLMEEKIINFINKFNLDLVHIHANNFGEINNKGYATVFEATFSPRKYNVLRDKNDNIFPVENLDQPNDKNNDDKKISFE